MKTKYTLILAACFAGTLAGCQEGAYTNLHCQDHIYQPECLDASNYMICVNQRLERITCPQNTWCDPQTVTCVGPQCQANTCQDNHTLIQCINGQSIPTPCPNGCQNGQCLSMPQTTCTTDICKNDKELIVCINGQTTEIICPNGCQNNRCITSSTTPNPILCQNDVCKNEQTLLKCQNGATFEITCPNGCQNNACLQPTNPNPPEPNPPEPDIPTCLADKCKDDNVLLHCQQDKTIEITCPLGCKNDQCLSIDPCETLTCDSGTCDKGVCITTQMANSKPGDACDYANFSEFCRGTTAVYCNKGTVVEENCGAAGCAIVELWETPMAFCSDDTSVCTQPNQTLSYCQTYNDGEQQFTYESLERCVVNTQGQYARVDLSEVGLLSDCDALGCNAENTHCQTPVPPLVCDTETSCQNDTFQFCYETILGVWSGSTDCTEQNMVCGFVDGTAACRKPCNTPNKVQYYCNNTETKSTKVESTCTLGDNNQYYESEKNTTCDHGCNPQTAECIQLSNDEGQTCQKDVFQERCEDTVAITCQDDIIKAENCTDRGPNYTCRLSAAGKRQCVEKCTTPGTTLSQCKTGDWDVTYDYICTQDKNGFNYYQLLDYTICSGHCNDAGDACLKLVPEEGEFCDTASYKTHCSNDILVFCEMDEITATDCAEKDAVCETIQNQSECYSSYDLCETPGQTDSYCTTLGGFGATTYFYTCQKAQSGNYYWTLTSTEACDNGYGQCDAEAKSCQ